MFSLHKKKTASSSDAHDNIATSSASTTAQQQQQQQQQGKPPLTTKKQSNRHILTDAELKDMADKQKVNETIKQVEIEEKSLMFSGAKEDMLKQLLVAKTISSRDLLGGGGGSGSKGGSGEEEDGTDAHTVTTDHSVRK
jgi:hypothetical protein